MKKLAALSLRQARRVAVLVVGGTVLAVGVALIVLPGPAVVVIPVGLAILAVEFAWARRSLKRIRDAADGAQQRLFGQANKNRDASAGDSSDNECPGEP